ncbi:DUF2274 domain-containing protein [Bordetella petrii]|uniref:DUF2274 domain-containing protein n=1 Tax=Bordetella petrii (strain ATCC BAA-461 / DSM 12804 / CCUG 43448 / CIP 107267 / Se-1111R) TaxID=340100 RepID=A9IF69_BORPD|nr:DUF2274 domain-containing protein [Bordetella petrii]MBO1112196.1 DUF2274 domain-containing protein [Bordetella petrii]MBO9354733.1 DUF2274 domain-containing protein [Bordetella petrii]CAP44978.1 conserved hypothetical protein [Bordetella petrii]
MATKLRLGPLPKQESVKLTVSLPTTLKADLDRYAAMHSQAYGEQVDAATLVPHMLAWFLKNDRGFRHLNN